MEDGKEDGEPTNAAARKGACRYVELTVAAFWRSGDTNVLRSLT
jgi:hypothetical protein